MSIFDTLTSDTDAVDAADVLEDTGTFADETNESTRPSDFSASDEPRESAPRRNAPRKSGARFFELVATFVGQGLEQSGIDYPVGRVVKFQAPMTGSKIDQLLAHTWLDRMLQPLFSTSETAESIGAIVLFPVCVGLYERNPAMGPALETVMRSVVHTTLVELAPMLRKQRTQERKAAAAIKDLNQLLDIEPGADPFDAIMTSIFAVPPRQQAADESMNGNTP